MEGILTVLTDKQQAVMRSIPFVGVPTDGAGLTRIVGIHFDRHTLLQEGFISDHALQLGKGPLRMNGIGLSLLLARLLATTAFGPLSDICQVFQANQRMRIGADNLFTHDMIGVLLQPSLPSTNHHQTAGSGAGAFSLQTLSQTCVMIGLGDKRLAGMKRLLAPGGSGYCKIADTHIDPNHTGMR